MFISDIILGAVLLLAGRKLFWVAVGILGFVVGMQFAAAQFPQADSLTIIVLAILFGVVGAIGAMVFEWVAILLIGFLGGGYFLMNIAAVINGNVEPIWWIFVIGGVVGVAVMVATFDLALILISSLVGGLLLIKHLPVDESLSNLIFIGILFVGIVVQYLSLAASEEDANTDSQLKTY